MHAAIFCYHCMHVLWKFWRSPQQILTVKMHSTSAGVPLILLSESLITAVFSVSQVREDAHKIEFNPAAHHMCAVGCSDCFLARCATLVLLIICCTFSHDPCYLLLLN
jgi:hypothetical protein